MVDRAKEIKSLINDSVEKVDNGSKRVDDADRSMADVVAQVKRVSDLIGDIAASTTEQSTGISQVNVAAFKTA